MHRYTGPWRGGYGRCRSLAPPSHVKPRIPRHRRLAALFVGALGLLVSELLVAVVLTRFTSTPAAAVILSVLFVPVALIGVASPLYRLAAVGTRRKSAA